MAKGYSRYWAFRPPVEGAVEEGEEGEEGGDADAAESARALPPVPEGGPDVTVVTVVKGPEPGDVLTSATRIYRIVLGRYHALVTSQRAQSFRKIARRCSYKASKSPRHTRPSPQVTNLAMNLLIAACTSSWCRGYLHFLLKC